ncbi:Ion transport peptide [Araneus ventricosus]|uniref:Ion transport peptide n=1 Tax=Araneus ventricosus TaxID=182803 RepID=A0A4Y2Q2W7_ARAVE|nr:Ion transport peptide [Araneus ventricosus]
MGINTDRSLTACTEAIEELARAVTMNPTIILTVLLVAASASEQGDSKRSFSDLGCMGVYDKAKFARLDRVCEECYHLFRESVVLTSCRSNCFKNEYFAGCVDALLLRKDQQRLDTMVDLLYGKRR